MECWSISPATLWRREKEGLLQTRKRFTEKEILSASQEVAEFEKRAGYRRRVRTTAPRGPLRQPAAKKKSKEPRK
jgi:hypothetical protein